MITRDADGLPLINDESFEDSNAATDQVLASVDMKRKVVLSTLLDHEVITRVMGRGDGMRTLAGETGARLLVNPPAEEHFSQWTVLMMYGTLGQLHSVVLDILRRDRANTSLGILVAEEHLELVLGQGRARLSEILRDSRAEVDVDPEAKDRLGFPVRALTISGSVDAMCRAFVLLADAVGQIPKEQGEEIQMQERIGNDTAAWVIGRNGETMHLFAIQSGAQIAITNRSDNVHEDFRVVTCTGTPKQARQAIALVMQKVAESEARLRMKAQRGPRSARRESREFGRLGSFGGDRDSHPPDHRGGRGRGPPPDDRGRGPPPDDRGRGPRPRDRSGDRARGPPLRRGGDHGPPRWSPPPRRGSPGGGDRGPPPEYRRGPRGRFSPGGHDLGPPPMERRFSPGPGRRGRRGFSPDRGGPRRGFSPDRGGPRRGFSPDRGGPRRGFSPDRGGPRRGPPPLDRYSPGRDRGPRRGPPPDWDRAPMDGDRWRDRGRGDWRDREPEWRDDEYGGPRDRGDWGGAPGYGERWKDLQREEYRDGHNPFASEEPPRKRPRLEGNPRRDVVEGPSHAEGGYPLPTWMPSPGLRKSIAESNLRASVGPIVRAAVKASPALRAVLRSAVGRPPAPQGPHP